MEHITIKYNSDNTKCRLVPDNGFMLKRGLDAQLYSEADGIPNKPKELNLWSAVVQ